MVIYGYIWLYNVKYVCCTAPIYKITSCRVETPGNLVVEISMEHAVGKPVGKAI